MSVFQYIPAMFWMTMVFVLILFIIRKRISLGNAFCLGALFLSLLFGLEPGAMFGSMVAPIVYPKTLALTVIGVFFGWLPLKNLDQLEKKRNMEKRDDRI